MKRAKQLHPVSDSEHLDALQLARLEQAFRDWAAQPPSESIRQSRLRILLIFLIIRYTGAKLNEVLTLCPDSDVAVEDKTITFCSHKGSSKRTVQVSESFMQEFDTIVRRLSGKSCEAGGGFFAVDPAFVRRKFYERVGECGFSKKQGGPEMVRKARALELIQENLPLPAVQQMLGLSSLDLASAHVAFSKEELHQATRWFVERESGRMTSARNSFFGKVTSVTRDKVQTLVRIATAEGHTITAIVTNGSADKMRLCKGRMVTAEIKALWLTVERIDRSGASSADNACEGTICSITLGKNTTECVVRASDHLELCAVASTPSFTALGLATGDRARVVFSCHSVILHAD